MNQGPSLFRLMQRIAETPSLITNSDTVKIGAIISDLLFDAGGGFLTTEQWQQAEALFAKNKNHKELILITCYLLHDPCFLAMRNLAAKMHSLLTGAPLKALAQVVKSRQFITDPERREELARLVLAHLELLPEGETANKAKDRLTTLDSVERVRLIEKTRQAQERRAEALREAMARKEAEEAASKMSRE